MSETNGTTVGSANIQLADETSILDKLHAEFIELHKGKTTDKRKKELVAALLNAQKQRVMAEQAVAAAKVAESDAVKAIVRECSGKAKISVKGETYTPASRGDSVYLRKVSTDAVELA